MARRGETFCGQLEDDSRQGHWGLMIYQVQPVAWTEFQGCHVHLATSSEHAQGLVPP